MGSPFSISDFISITERAYDLYKRLEAAKGQYSNLAKSVSILHGILDETKVHLEEESSGLAQAPRKKKDALVHARLGCEDALDDVEALLKKYPSLGSKASTTILERFSFISHDINGLEKSLDVNGNNLQRCLTALTSVSVLRLQKALDKIAEDVRSGKREKSVLSEALVGHKRVEIPDVLRDTESALMEENIHPDAIDLHNNQVKEWVMNTIAEEDGQSVPAPVREDPWESAFAAPALATSSKRQIPAKADSDDEFYGSSQLGARAPPSPSAGDQGRLALLQPPSEGPSSRRTSVGSHRSKADTWHPTNEPNPEYVSSMLMKALTVDPLQQNMDMENATFYFKRAFRQQDCYDRESLTRPEVASICEDALQRLDVQLGTGYIARLVHEGDQDKDGRVDFDEFLTIMLNVLMNTSESVAEKLKNTFNMVAQRAEEVFKDNQHRREPNLSLPWGFRRTPLPPFLDEVEMVDVDIAPLALPPWTYSIMANDVASHCVAVINQVERQWTQVLPDGNSRTTFRETFDKVRSAAVKFTTLLNAVDQALLSDLDEMMAVLYWFQVGEPTSPIASSFNFNDLRAAQASCYKLARQIKGFVFRLQHREPDDFTGASISQPPSTVNFRNDFDKWKKSYMDAWANLIYEEASELWPQVDDTIRNSRNWYNQAANFRSKAISPVKYAPADQQSLRTLSTHSQELAQNALNLQAFEIARRYCHMERNEEERHLAYMRASGRSCRLQNVSFERKSKKSLFSTAKLDMEIAAQGRTYNKLWESPHNFVKPGSLPNIDFALPDWANFIEITIHEHAKSSVLAMKLLTRHDLESRHLHSWESERGILHFRVDLADDPAKHFERAQSPWFQYIKGVYELPSTSNGAP